MTGASSFEGANSGHQPPAGDLSSAAVQDATTDMGGTVSAKLCTATVHTTNTSLDGNRHKSSQNGYEKEIYHNGNRKEHNSTEFRNHRNTVEQENKLNENVDQKVVCLWNYDDNDSEKGPANWEVKGSRLLQSPIDLQLSRMKTLIVENDPLKFVNYSEKIAGEFVNTGYSVQFRPESRINMPEIYGGLLEQSYRFVQYHYHWSQNDNEGSEHSFGGLYYSAELHLVHQGVDDPSKLAVLAVFLKIDKYADGDALSAEESVLARVTDCGQRVDAPPQCLERKLPDNFTFLRYEGSLTTPPCTENVTWTVFTDPVSITPKQMSALRSLKDHSGRVLKCNCRPTQNLNGRSIFLAL